MEAQDAGNVKVAGEGSETYGSMKAPELNQGAQTKEAGALAKAFAVKEARENIPIKEGQLAAGLVTVPERVPGPIDPASQIPNEPTLEEKLEDLERPDQGLPEPEPPIEGAAPTLTSLCKGSGFTAESKIIWNGGEEPTTFGDPTTVSTLVKPSTVDPGLQLPFSLPVLVRTGAQDTEPLQFTFVAAGAEPPVVDNTLPPPQ
jgi:hypothetical protein